MTQKQFSRRTVMAWLAGLPLLPTRALSAPPNHPLNSPVSDLRQIMSNGYHEDAEKLGKSYLAMFPSEASEAQLLELVFEGAESPPDNNNALKRALALKQHNDFKSGNLVLVDDWYLSRTEARIYALSLFC
ncbi:MAG: hypothetical protein ABW162_04075 [Candidatus Sedimenticola sp. PURPLELP]